MSAKYQCYPKKATTSGLPDEKAWWYANKSGIELYVRHQGTTRRARITMKQLREFARQMLGERLNG